MNLEEKLSVINSIPPTKGIFGFTAETLKTTDNGGVLKKSRKTGEPTPTRLSRITTLFSGTVFMGTDYQEMVNKQRAKEGVRPDFEASPTYCKPVSENRLLYQHNTTGQLYFRVYLGYGATMTSEIEYRDFYGKVIPHAEYKKIKEEYLKKDSDNAKQGLVDTIEVRNYKVENIIKLKRHETWIDKTK